LSYLMSSPRAVADLKKAGMDLGGSPMSKAISMRPGKAIHSLSLMSCGLKPTGGGPRPPTGAISQWFTKINISLMSSGLSGRRRIVKKDVLKQIPSLLEFRIESFDNS
jgi:hypothetical protein